MIVLFSAQAATGQSAAQDWPSGPGNVFAYGTFGGGTVALEASPDGGTTWVTVQDVAGAAVSFTANGNKNVSLGPGLKLRGNLSGGAGPYSVNLRIF
jgi:hypothetical protein